MELFTKGLVSIIVPSFNQGKFIGETIESILSQDYRPIEILVLDGGSRDQTVEILKSFSHNPELKWWSAPDRGVADAVNKGLSIAKGEFIAIQSSDDVYLPGSLSAAVDHLNSHRDTALVYGDVELIDAQSQVIGRDIQGSFDLRDYLGRFSYIPQPCAFFRADAGRAVGGWREEVSYAADADYWMRIALRNRVVKIDRMMARYRYHEDQRDSQKAKIARDWETAVRDLLKSNNLDGSTKRFAEMGIYLARYRYTSETDWLNRSRYLYLAAAANPFSVLRPEFPKRELLIGREPIWRMLSRIKRALGLSPRASIAS